MSELSINKRMKVIKLYLQGYSYDEIVKKAGVAKGTVYNIISDLKEGLFPEISNNCEFTPDTTGKPEERGNGLSPVESMLIMLPWLNYGAVHCRGHQRLGLTKQPQNHNIGVLATKDHLSAMKLHYQSS
jgi:hypothetical protein